MRNRSCFAGHGKSAEDKSTTGFVLVLHPTDLAAGVGSLGLFDSFGALEMQSP